VLFLDSYQLIFAEIQLNDLREQDGQVGRHVGQQVMRQVYLEKHASHFTKITGHKTEEEKV
jgi:hypothetical protein